MVVCDANCVYSPCSLEAVPPSVALLQEVLAEHSCPVWINADVLPGPGGQATPLEPQAFLAAVGNLPCDTVLSLGWTTGWTAGTDNPGEDIFFLCLNRDFYPQRIRRNHLDQNIHCERSCTLFGSLI